MHVEGDGKTTPPQLADGVPEFPQDDDFGNCRMSFNKRSTQRLDQHVNSQIGAPFMKRLQRRQGEHHVADGAQTNDQHIRVAGQIRQDR